MRILTSKFSRPLILIFLFSPAWASDGPSLTPQPLRVREKHLIYNGIQVSMTPRGMKYFKTNLSEILTSQGLSPDKGYFAGFLKNFEQSYRVDDLGLPKTQRDLLSTSLDLLNQWFGLSLKEFRPTFQISDINYSAQFNRFSLIPDENLLRRLGKTDGAVLVLEVEIKNASLTTDSLRVGDQNKPRLGQVGGDKVSVKIGSKQAPLKIRLPFYVGMNRNQELEFEAIELDSNIDMVGLELTYKKLVVPPLGIIVNRQIFEVPQSKIESETQRLLPEILRKAKIFLKEFATQQLPSYLNGQAKTLLTGNLEDLSVMTPAGSDDNPCLPQPEPHIWGMKLADINMNNSLNILLDVFIEDPVYPNTAVTESMNAKGKPLFSQVSSEKYDLAFSVDRGYINRMLQLSYDRGLFNNMPVDKLNPTGPKMDLLMQPEWDITTPPAGAPRGPEMTYIKMKTKLKIHKGFLTDFTERLALIEPFDIRLDVILQMRKMETGEIRLFYYDVDPASISIGKEFIRLASNIVHQRAIKTLQKITKKWRDTKTEVTSQPIAIRRELFGIPLEPQTILFDSNGNLLLFMVYAKPGSSVSMNPTKPPAQCNQRGGK